MTCGCYRQRIVLPPIAFAAVCWTLYSVVLYYLKISPIGQVIPEAPMKVFSVAALAVAAFAAAAATFAAPAVGHHSFAMFDADKTITLKGTVKEFEWTNPHAWLRVIVDDETAGKPVVWALELSSPARLVTMGMRADSVRPGDAVSVTFHPMKDGARGGQFIQAVLPGGKQVLRANARDENEER
jgi:hypothetical protein